MKDLGHGANVEEISKKYNIDPKEIIDFSSNINPKVIDGLEKYILEGLTESKSYPDINYTRLRKNLSKYLKVNPKYIIPGNGATEIIYLLMKSIDKKLAILNPTFSEYKRGAELNGLEIYDLNLDKDNEFKINLKKIKDNLHKFNSLFICNPNNPSGNVQNIKELLDLMKANNKLLIVDETFMEFVETENDSLVKFVEEYDNLFIIKAVTKFFGMPGLRLGYGLTSNKSIIEKIYHYKEPWTVNSFAEVLANYIFEDEEYIRKSKDYFVNERKYMLKELSQINSIEANPTDANFILIKLTNNKASYIKEKLLENSKILIRDASNFEGLNQNYIRIAIKSHDENISLIQNLKRLLGE